MAANGKPHIHKFTIDVPLGVQNDLQGELCTVQAAFSTVACAQTDKCQCCSSSGHHAVA